MPTTSDFLLVLPTRERGKCVNIARALGNGVRAQLYEAIATLEITGVVDIARGEEESVVPGRRSSIIYISSAPLGATFISNRTLEKRLHTPGARHSEGESRKDNAAH